MQFALPLARKKPGECKHVSNVVHPQCARLFIADGNTPQMFLTLLTTCLNINVGKNRKYYTIRAFLQRVKSVPSISVLQTLGGVTSSTIFTM